MNNQINGTYLDAWRRDQKVTEDVVMLADGDSSFARKMGLSKETGSFGGIRSERYALLAVDGKVVYLGRDEKGVNNSRAEIFFSKL